jgi:branched-chain amino acid transport system substrate-binding protein
MISKNTLKAGRFMGALVLVMALLPACTTEQPPPPPPEVRIGLISYKDEAVEKISIETAARMALDTLDDQGGLLINGVHHNVSVVTEHIDSSSPERAVEAVRRLINQAGVVAIVGPLYSSDAIPAGKVAQDAMIPLIAPISTNPRTTLRRSYVFRMGFMDEFQGTMALEFCAGELKAKYVAVIYNISDPYSKGVAQSFRDSAAKRGLVIGAFESFITDDTDITRQLSVVLKADPDVLFVPTFSKEAKMVASQAKKAGIKAIFMGADGWDRSDFSKDPDFDDSFMTAQWSHTIENERVNAFVNDFRKMTGTLPGDTAALGFDAFMMLFEAMMLANSADPTSIRNGLYDLEPYPGVGGLTDFIGNGDPVKGGVILHLADGEVSFRSIITPPEGS